MRANPPLKWLFNYAQECDKSSAMIYDFYLHLVVCAASTVHLHRHFWPVIKFPRLTVSLTYVVMLQLANICCRGRENPVSPCSSAEIFPLQTEREENSATGSWEISATARKSAKTKSCWETPSICWPLSLFCSLRITTRFGTTHSQHPLLPPNNFGKMFRFRWIWFTGHSGESFAGPPSGALAHTHTHTHKRVPTTYMLILALWFMHYISVDF